MKKPTSRLTKLNKILIGSIILLALYTIYLTWLVLDIKSAHDSVDAGLAQQIFQLQTQR